MEFKGLNLFEEAIKNLRRNLTASITSIFTVMFTLLILGMFLLMVFNVKIAITDLYSKFEIQVTFKDNTKTSDKENIYNRIKTSSGVTEITYEKDGAPASCTFRVNNPNNIPKITTQISELDGVDRIESRQNIPSDTIAFAAVFQIIGLLLYIILIIISFFLIKGTLKIAINTRINEISIMQYIGATDCFIKCHFVIEGIIIGFLGSISSVLAIYLFYSLIYHQWVSYLENISINFINPSFILTAISWCFSLTGILLSSLGSLSVIRKYLIY